MVKPVRRLAPDVFRAMFPDAPDWPAPWTALLASWPARTFRVEEIVRDGHYVIRAELPGLDPAKDIEVTVDGGTLTIHAERWQQDKEPSRTEFRYGSVTRSIRLPAQVDAQDITASYRKGILEVSIPMPGPAPEGTRIPVENADVPGASRAAEPAAGSEPASSASATSAGSAASAPDSGSAQQ